MQDQTDDATDEPTDDGQPYEVKTIRVHLPEKGQYVYLMLTRFDGTDHILSREGWGGEYIRYGRVARHDAAETVATGDAFEFVRKNGGLRGTAAERLVKDIDMGPIAFEDLRDQQKLTPDDIEELR